MFLMQEKTHGCALNYSVSGLQLSNGSTMEEIEPVVTETQF